ncbi:MAG TPA: 3-dehydroquinate synthase [Candidatus Omnitrophota bacterium]|nr:3-dehydroquinate synthase [Candidatus Omnitrophota bacterium]
MKIVRVSLKENSYKIVIGHRILPKLGAYVRRLNIGRDAVVVTNPTVGRRYAKAVVRSLKGSGIRSKVLFVPDSEESKSVKVAFDLIERIAKDASFKGAFIVSLGGGVVGDVAGFVAAVYQRGVPYIQVPTTFLAQIDSAIGGKVGIDLKQGKNLVGAFYQPKLVFSDVDCLASLNRKQLRNGLAEAIKYGIIDYRSLFSFIEKNAGKLLAGDRSDLTKLVECCSRIKAKVVVADEKETKGIRSILNFGHTIGHAIEAAGRYKGYQHGEAIALGMRVASDISVSMKLLSRKEEQRINDLITHVGLPRRIRGIKLSDILKAMRHDKKFPAGRNRFVLATRIGKVKLVTGVPLSVIAKTILKYK